MSAIDYLREWKADVEAGLDPDRDSYLRMCEAMELVFEYHSIDPALKPLLEAGAVPTDLTVESPAYCPICGRGQTCDRIIVIEHALSRYTDE